MKLAKFAACLALAACSSDDSSGGGAPVGASWGEGAPDAVQYRVVTCVGDFVTIDTTNAIPDQWVRRIEIRYVRDAPGAAQFRISDAAHQQSFEMADGVFVADEGDPLRTPLRLYPEGIPCWPIPTIAEIEVALWVTDAP